MSYKLRITEADTARRVVHMEENLAYVGEIWHTEGGDLK